MSAYEDIGTALQSASANGIVSDVLGSIRRHANRLRSLGQLRDFDGHAKGLAQGQIIIAGVYMQADRDRVMAAKNEIRYLLGAYLRRQ